MKYAAINLRDKLALINEQWSPKVIAEMNEIQFKVVKLQGEFMWHEHTDTDEVFMLIEGAMGIEFRDGRVNLSAAEMFVVPKGVGTNRLPSGVSVIFKNSLIF